MDENKTALTHRVTAIAAAYLDGLGCKPIETEVKIRAGWIADLASYWYPTNTEAKRLHLDRRAREVLGIGQHVEVEGLVPRAYGHGPFTVAVEVKTTPSDFKRDTKWQAREWPAHICLVAFPSGVLTKGDIPDGWYGLETSRAGTQLRKVHSMIGAYPHSQHSGVVIDFIAAVGIRRDHRTRYTATKAFFKAYYAEERERKARYSGARLLTGLAKWVQGTDWNPGRRLVDVLPELGIKKVPRHCEGAVTFFEAMKAAGLDQRKPEGA